MTDYETAEETYKNFWKLIVEKDGEVDMKQVKKELHDFHFVMAQVSMVYSELTGGQLSKPHYYADGVITEVNRYFDMIRQDEIEDQAEHGVFVVDTTNPDLWDKIYTICDNSATQTEEILGLLSEYRMRGNELS